MVGDSESCTRNKILIGACTIATPERCLYDRTYTQDNLLKRPLILLAFRSRLSDFYHIMTTLVSLLFFDSFAFSLKMMKLLTVVNSHRRVNWNVFWKFSMRLIAESAIVHSFLSRFFIANIYTQREHCTSLCYLKNSPRNCAN